MNDSLENYRDAGVRNPAPSRRTPSRTSSSTTPRPGSRNPHLALGVTPSPSFTQSSREAGGLPTGYRPPEGVPFSRVPQVSGVFGSQRLGFNPDALERFPYGYQYSSATAGTAKWTELSPAYRDYIDSLAKHPNIGSKTSTGRMLWERLNSLAAESTARGENVSPQILVAQLAAQVGIGSELGSATDVLDQILGGSSGGGSYGGGGYGGGSSTQMTIDLTSPQQARGLLMQTIQGVLGRNPTDDEYSQFVSVLNEAQTANPQVVSAAGDTVTRSGGVDAGLVALDYAQSRDDYEDRQANQYYNMFLDVLAGG